MLLIPSAGRWLRSLWLIYGILVFVWLGPEDSLIWRPVALGAAGVLLVALHAGAQWQGERLLPARCWIPSAAVAGALFGGGTALGAAVLMFFKNALHAHIFPDYPLALILAVLERAPAWSLAGLFGCMGMALAALGFGLNHRDR